MVEERGRIGRLVLIMAAFLVIGAPLAAYIWHVLSDLLAGRVRPGPIGIALAFLLVFLFLLAGLIRFVLPPAERRGGG